MRGAGIGEPHPSRSLSSATAEHSLPTPLPLEAERIPFRAHAREVIQARGVLAVLIGREIRVRYKQAGLGFAWALAQPFALMVLFTLVFNRVLGLSTERVPYPLLSYLALLSWSFLSSCLTFGSMSLVGNPSLVTKVYFPRELLTAATVAAAAFDFLIGLGVFLGFLGLTGATLTWTLIYVPLLVLAQAALGLGFALVLAALNVTYRDFRFIVPLGLQVWMFLSPIAYPIDRVAPRVRPWFFLNPVAGIVECYTRVVLLGQSPGLVPLASALVPAAVCLVLGYHYFKSSEWRFADVI